jgi:hypothetical protein
MNEHFVGGDGSAGLVMLFFMIYIIMIVAMQYKYGIKGGIGTAVLIPVILFMA